MEPCKNCNRDVPIENKDLWLCASCNKEARDNDIDSLYPEARNIHLQSCIDSGKVCPRCGKEVDWTFDIHHKAGTIGFADQWARRNNIPLSVDLRYFLAVDRECHQWITQHSSIAIAKGWSLARTGILESPVAQEELERLETLYDSCRDGGEPRIPVPRTDEKQPSQETRPKNLTTQMKQKGKIWTDSQGDQVPEKHLHINIKRTEVVASAIADEAEKIHAKIIEAQKWFVEFCQEIGQLLAAERGKQTNDITFYSFDKEFKIEFEHDTKFVRVFKANKKDPSQKDYDQLYLNINAVPMMEAFLKKVDEALPDTRRGDLKYTSGGDVKFEDNPKGSIVVHESPQQTKLDLAVPSKEEQMDIAKEAAEANIRSNGSEV